MTTTTASHAASRPTIGHAGVPGLRLIRSEIRKVFTTNAWWLFAIAALVISGLALWANLAQAAEQLSEARHSPYAPPPPELAEHPDAVQQWTTDHNLHQQIVKAASNVFTSGSFFGFVLVMVLGALVMTNEFQHQTATATFLTTPRRSRVIIGKLAAAFGLGTLFWALSQAVSMVGGLLFFSNIDVSNGLGEWAVQRAILFNLAAYLLWALFGFGLGTLIRNQIGAIVTSMGVYLIGYAGGITVFILIHNFMIKKDWVMTAAVSLPPVASQVMISTEKLYEQAPAWWVGALVMIGWSLLFGVIGILLTRRRDIS